MRKEILKLQAADKISFREAKAKIRVAYARENKRYLFETTRPMPTIPHVERSEAEQTPNDQSPILNQYNPPPQNLIENPPTLHSQNEQREDRETLQENLQTFKKPSESLNPNKIKSSISQPSDKTKAECSSTPSKPVQQSSINKITVDVEVHQPREQKNTTKDRNNNSKNTTKIPITSDSHKKLKVAQKVLKEPVGGGAVDGESQYEWKMKGRGREKKRSDEKSRGRSESFTSRPSTGLAVLREYEDMDDDLGKSKRARTPSEGRDSRTAKQAKSIPTIIS